MVAAERADLNRLRSQLAEQQRILDDITSKKREAEQTATQLSRQYQQQLAASFDGPVGDGPIRVCPVGQPRGCDDFGAPRYTGGYHPHAGNDIFAPMGTPISAPFDGYAYDASNTLGGLSVIVRGSEGYVYNAHLSRFGKLGNVATGGRHRIRGSDRRHEHAPRPLRMAPERDANGLAGERVRVLGDRRCDQPAPAAAPGLLTSRSERDGSLATERPLGLRTRSMTGRPFIAVDHRPGRLV